MTQPDEVKFLPSRYSFRYGDGVEFRMERFDNRRDGLTVELTTMVMNGRAPRMLDFGNFNISSPTTRRSQAKALHESYPKVPQEEWLARLKVVCFRAAEQYRNGGEPFVDLSTVEVNYSRPSMLLHPYVPESGIVVDYGDGEAGKSLFTLAQIMTIATGHPYLDVRPAKVGPVMYLDWEDDAETHSERARALARGSGGEFPAGSVMFRRMDRPLVDTEERVRNEITDRGIVCVAADSLGMLVGTDPSDPEAVLRNINALRRLGPPVILIHHLSAEQAYGKARKEKGYGTIYTRNSARLQWLLEKSEDVLYLTHTKANRSEKHARRAYRFSVENNEHGRMVSARYTAVSAAGYREDMDSLTDFDVVRMFLRDKRAPVTVIAERTGLSESAVRTVFSRHAESFISDDSRPKLWGLRSDRDE